MDEPKECENCRHYLQHYVKGLKSFKPVNCGHCMGTGKIKTKPAPCENWEDKAIKEQERKRSINEALITMSKRLDEISSVLKNN